MGINFPASPTVGQKYPQPAVAGVPVYTWDGEKWTTVGGSIAAYAPPADAVPLMDATPGLVGTTTEYAREDHVHPTDTSRASVTDLNDAIAAADSTFGSQMAYSGMQINGGMEVSQQYAAGLLPGWLNFNGYLMDGWKVWLYQASAGSTAFSVGQVLSGFVISSSAQIVATGAANFAGATDQAIFSQYIEGYRWSRLGFGYANAQSVTVSFWVYAKKTGTAHLLIGSAGTQPRCYINSFTVIASDTWEYKTLTFPPDVTGPANWLIGNGNGAAVTFCFGGGATTKAGTANVWANWSTQFATAAQSNFFASNNDYVYITGVTVLPGTQAPTAAQSPNIMRPFDQELLTCKRYWQSSYDYGVAPGTPWGLSTAHYYYSHVTAIFDETIPISPAMRAAPTITVYASTGGVNGLDYYNGSAWTVTAPGGVYSYRDMALVQHSAAGSYLTNFALVKDARL